MKKTRASLERALKTAGNPKRAMISRRFFKTGKGEYGEGDIFLGITVPMQRRIAKAYTHLSLSDLALLLKSPIHEYRFVALVILILQFKKADDRGQKKIAAFYLKYRVWVNNWDLVDTSAPYLLGAYLMDKEKDVLYRLAVSRKVWDRRIAIIATQYFIQHGSYDHTMKIAEVLLHDTHDLIHKAVGWMLREVGKRSLETEEQFLRIHHKDMPRTMLRYAIERFPKEKRELYL
ncbi:MAG TPA: DNA alkylation repair protein [Candidatus Kapabacteria bacterium]|nr:DNA alkylation repair protein [Candidatus Kapabacteria bacterium]